MWNFLMMKIGFVFYQIAGNMQTKTKPVILKVAVISTENVLWIIEYICIHLQGQKPIELV